MVPSKYKSNVQRKTELEYTQNWWKAIPSKIPTITNDSYTLS